MCRMVTPMCLADPRGSRRAVCNLNTLFCAELLLADLHEVLLYIVTESSKRRYPNAHMSSTNTGNSTKGRRCVGSVFVEIVGLGYVREEIVLESILYDQILRKSLLCTKTHIGECGLDCIRGWSHRPL